MGTGKRRGGRTTPKGTRPGHLRPVRGGAGEASPVDGIIDGGARDVLAADDPVAAEVWASQLLGAFDSARLQASLAGQDVPPFEEAILERCEERGDRNALVVAAALAAVLPPPLDDRARQAATAARRSAGGPPWVDDIGRAVPARAWVASDVFCDQDSLIVAFTQPDGGGHAILGLVDHNLSGQAKDAWIAADADEVVAAWASTGDEHMRICEVPVESMLGRLREAMAAANLWNGDAGLRTEEFADHRALVWARLRRAVHGEPTAAQLEVTQSERARLVADFLASEPGRDLRTEAAHVDLELLARCLVDLRSDYEGRPLRWSPTVVELVLGDLAPRKLLLNPEQTAALPAVLAAFVRFAAARTGLEPEFLEEIVAAVEAAEAEYLDRMSDPAASGPAKAMLSLLQARGVALDDPDAINAALSMLGPVELATAGPKRRPTPADAPAEVVEAASRAPVLARLATLADFYGEGRKLTQKGQPTLADARTLVGLLGTDDRFDETIGDKTFKTRSAAELPELAFTIRWATTAGALRKEHGKLRATATWRKLQPKPLERWLRAADALPSLGPLAAFHAQNPYRGPGQVLDELLEDLLHHLEPGPMPFEAALDDLLDLADTMYEWRSPYLQDPDRRRSSFRYDLDLLTRILGWAGILERVGATIQPDRWGHRDRLADGTLHLTTLGRWRLATR